MHRGIPATFAGSVLGMVCLGFVQPPGRSIAAASVPGCAYRARRTSKQAMQGITTGHCLAAASGVTALASESAQPSAGSTLSAHRPDSRTRTG
eukprot:2253204-Rhodomonas_salina.1